MKCETCGFETFSPEGLAVHFNLYHKKGSLDDFKGDQ